MTSKPGKCVRRAYNEVGDQDGKRVLVDWLWPRGIRKPDAHLDEWCKDVAPSTAQRCANGTATIRRSSRSSAAATEALKHLRELADGHRLTLLTADQTP